MEIIRSGRLGRLKRIRRSGVAVLLGLVLGAAPVLGTGSRAELAPTGSTGDADPIEVVVESAPAPFEPGDLVEAIGLRGEPPVPIESIVDALFLAQEAGGEPFDLVTRRGELRVEGKTDPGLLLVRPEMAGRVLELYRDGRNLLEGRAGDDPVLVGTEDPWGRAAAIADSDEVVFWLEASRVEALRYQAAYSTAEEAARRALAAAERLGSSRARALARQRLGELLAAGGRLDEAVDQYLLVVESTPDTVVAAQALDVLGDLTRRRFEFASAEQYHRRALEIWSRLAPRSIGHTTSLDLAGVAAASAGDLDRAVDYLEAAIADKPAEEAALSWYNLGVVLANLGDLAAADEAWGSSVDASAGQGPRSRATRLSNLGLLARHRGELVRSEALLTEALELYEEATARLEASVTGEQLGLTLAAEGRLEEAEGRLAEAFGRRVALGVAPSKVAPLAVKLAEVRWRLGRSAAARPGLVEVIDGLPRIDPDGRLMARALALLGRIDREIGDDQEAVDRIATELGRTLPRGRHPVAESELRLALAESDLAAGAGERAAAAMRGVRQVEAGRRSDSDLLVRALVGEADASARDDLFRHALGLWSNRRGSLRRERPAEIDATEIERLAAIWLDRLVEEGDHRSAAALAESGPSRRRVARFRGRDLVLAHRLGDELDRELRRATATADALRDQLNGPAARNPAERDSLKADLTAKLEELAQLEKKAVAAWPDYALLVRIEEGLPGGRSNRRLPPGLARVIVGLGESGFHLFVDRGGGVEFVATVASSDEALVALSSLPDDLDLVMFGDGRLVAELGRLSGAGSVVRSVGLGGVVSLAAGDAQMVTSCAGATLVLDEPVARLELDCPVRLVPGSPFDGGLVDGDGTVVWSIARIVAEAELAGTTVVLNGDGADAEGVEPLVEALFLAGAAAVETGSIRWSR